MHKIFLDNHETHKKHEKKVQKLLFGEECYAIQGAVFEVYREMGCGFFESVYQECLEREFRRQKIPFIAQQILELFYKGDRLVQVYKPDFVCYEKIIVELKAVKSIGREHEAQVFNYLKASKFRLGLIVNFGHYPKATVKRIIL
ncbi:MAG: GxxExxY protein [Desulfobulbaceae bacterium]|nr:GxxExxY protein [Desulfobulbaceae bacterium]